MKRIKKLVLKKETIAELSEKGMSEVKGGTILSPLTTNFPTVGYTTYIYTHSKFTCDTKA